MRSPWHISPTHLGAAYDVGADDGANICLVHGPENGGPEEFKANAQLIALAPVLAEENARLREALKNVPARYRHLFEAARVSAKPGTKFSELEFWLSGAMYEIDVALNSLDALEDDRAAAE